jgi:hypothetical protein
VSDADLALPMGRQWLSTFDICTNSAKHLRSKDRTINNQHYPKVFYPELYILEGGYCDFYKNCPVSVAFDSESPIARS